MKTKQPTPAETKRARDPDFVGANIAIQRAALRARERAKRAGIGIVISQNGKVVEINPDDVDKEPPK